ncbi:flagellar biosynthesis protein FlhF [Clostridium sp. UBA6640]|uniref:flagellar biosynthesis protein FlhF n=1 Tax=Clostridium sp. UBA6640 TaxID=1946370 RepID=UPI0025C4F2AC|nr:flagellar biosynthesis protein FlhF [Clostridium sp. UBA6640]
MIIKKYVATNMNEALTRIRQELGKDAVIISQRRIKKNGIKGFFGKKVLEVTAATESNEKENFEVDLDIVRPKEHRKEDEKNLIDAILRSQISRNNDKFSETKNVRNDEVLIEEKENTEIYKEVMEMKNMITSLLNGEINSSIGDTDKTNLGLILEDADVCTEVTENILNSINSGGSEEEKLEEVKKIIGDMVSIEELDVEGTVAFIGPTGVGKTTTIAKLAGRLALVEKKKVGLITIDTYRIGAVEQLKTYAEIMNIPFKVVFTMKDMEAAIESMKDCETILVDTTGRSSKNTMQLSELRAFVEKTNAKSVNLVVSATTKNKDIKIISDSYKALNFNRVIITKLDETSTYGSILNIIKEVGVPLSFITTGQNVPEDIKCPESSEIASLIIGEKNIC